VTPEFMPAVVFSAARFGSAIVIPLVTTKHYATGWCANGSVSRPFAASLFWKGMIDPQLEDSRDTAEDTESPIAYLRSCKIAFASSSNRSPFRLRILPRA
jgi:hypothetical protein